MQKKISALILMLLMIFLVSACAKQPEQKPNQQEPAPQEQKTGAAKVNVIDSVYEQWQKSAHAKAVGAENPKEAPGLREEGNCFKCHNGYAFEIKADKLEGIGILKGQSCDTCHTGQGRELMTKGTVTVPIGDFKAGKGSLCVACHNGRGKKPDGKSAPHGSVQADILYAKSGAEVEGFKYGTHAHGKNTDACLSCHMAEGKNGVKDHSFKMSEENIANSCGKCHGKITNFNPTAKGDFDGNGSKQGIQDEVTGLLKLLQTQINAKLNGGKFVSNHGQIVFQDASGKDMATKPDIKVYNAAWNYFLVTNSGAKGIHNPVYTVQLLQQSYKNLTGKDVPNAEIRK